MTVTDDRRDGGDGLTALHVACIHGKRNVVQVLLEHGADVNVAAAASGDTPILLASEHNHETVVGLLLAWQGGQGRSEGRSKGRMQDQEVGHSESNSASSASSARSASSAVSCDVNRAGIDGKNPLQVAVENGNAAIVSALLDAGANPNFATANGGTSLVAACYRGKLEIVALLLAHGAEVDNARAASGAGGFTALLAATWRGHVAVVRLLLERGAAVEQMTATGETAMALATKKGFQEVVKVVQSFGGDPGEGGEVVANDIERS
jgi:ankyrin repeat protein